MAGGAEGEGPPGRALGIILDPDANGLQLLAVPGGSPKSTEPAGRIVEGDALVKPDRPARSRSARAGCREVARVLSAVLRQGDRVARANRTRAAFEISGTRLVIETAQPAKSRG